MRLVEWLDSCSEHGWQPLTDSKKIEPDHCSSVGFVIADTDEYLTLLQSFTNRKDAAADQGDNSICIPKFAILNSITIREGTQ